ncbi:hypothetical protein ACFLYR_07940 [Chloroflexota bacterium]
MSRGFRRIEDDTFNALMAAKLTGSGYQIVLVVIDRTLLLFVNTLCYSILLLVGRC